MAVIPALAIIAYTSLQVRARDIAEAQARARRVCGSIVEGQDDAIAAGRELLEAAAEIPALREGPASAHAEPLRRLLEGEPGFLNLGVIGPDGDLLSSALPFEAPLDMKGGSYYRRALEARAFAVGDYQIGRITRQGSLNVVLPLLEGTGRVGRAFFASIDLGRVLRLRAVEDLPAGSVVLIVDDGGTVVLRKPDPLKVMGKEMREHPLVRTLLAVRDGTTETVGLDGAARLAGFVPLRHRAQPLGAVLSVTTPSALAYAQANRMLTQNLALMGIASALAIAAAWVLGDVLVRRRIVALIAAAGRVTAGDLPTRAARGRGGAEFGRLERAFDAMTDAVGDREASLRKAEEGLRRLNAELERRVQERTAELERAKLQLEAFFNQSLDLTAVADLDGYFKRLNPPWEKALGWPVEELLARPWLRKPWRAAVLASWAGTRGGESSTLRLRPRPPRAYHFHRMVEPERIGILTHPSPEGPCVSTAVPAARGHPRGPAPSRSPWS